MKRIAIIDHNEHDLIIEDINEEVLEKQYGGDGQKYIEDHYDIENYSWNWIIDSYYLPNDDDGDFITVEFSKLI